MFFAQEQKSFVIFLQEQKMVARLWTWKCFLLMYGKQINFVHFSLPELMLFHE